MRVVPSCAEPAGLGGGDGLLGDGVEGVDLGGVAGTEGAGFGWGGGAGVGAAGLGAGASPVGKGPNPGGVGNSSTGIGLPALWSLIASSYCFTIRPNRLALPELPSALAAASTDLYLSRRCCNASNIVLGSCIAGAGSSAAGGGGVGSGAAGASAAACIFARNSFNSFGGGGMSLRSTSWPSFAALMTRSNCFMILTNSMAEAVSPDFLAVKAATLYSCWRDNSAGRLGFSGRWIVVGIIGAGAAGGGDVGGVDGGGAGAARAGTGGGCGWAGSSPPLSGFLTNTSGGMSSLLMLRPADACFNISCNVFSPLLNRRALPASPAAFAFASAA